MSKHAGTGAAEWRDRALARAKEVIGNAYAPYSDFHVAAVVVSEDDELFAGVNVENATYGATVCAERNAVSAAVTAGVTSFKGVLILTETEEPKAPCGICRQVLREFGEELTVYSAGSTGTLRRWSLRELLPDSFSSDDLS
jgi:cytidine deaminase